MTTDSSSNAGPTHKLVEAGITLLIALFGVIVIIGSMKAGINWGAEGPRAGFFPFYIGIFIVVVQRDQYLERAARRRRRACSPNGDSFARS